MDELTETVQHATALFDEFVALADEAGLPYRPRQF